MVPAGEASAAPRPLPIEEAAMGSNDAIRLWDGPAPGSQTWAHEEVAVTTFPDAPGAIRNVVVPTLTPYVPATPGDGAVIVLPGGAFHILSMNNEGSAVARHLADQGVAGFVLKYRVVPTPADEDGFHQAIADAFRGDMEAAIAEMLPLAVADAERAVELVRAQGYTWVCLIGFSAGGRVTAEVISGRSVHRPDAAALIYPPPSRRVVAPSDAPPVFIAGAADDPLVGTKGSLMVFDAWQEASRPAELHLFEHGGHGFGMKRQGLPVDRWMDCFLAWLSSQWA
jgi:acetyl esterase/lipase